jgi:hypothetical protein
MALDVLRGHVYLGIGGRTPYFAARSVESHMPG